MSSLSHEANVAYLDVILVTLELMVFPTGAYSSQDRLTRHSLTACLPTDVLDIMTLARNVFAENKEADLTSLACRALIGAFSHIAYAEADISFFLKLFVSIKKAKGGSESTEDDAHKTKEMERTYTDYLLATQASGETAVGPIIWFDAHNFDTKMWKECRAMPNRRKVHVSKVHCKGIQIILQHWTKGKSSPNTCSWAQERTS
jgi:hypothetical protein